MGIRYCSAPNCSQNSKKHPHLSFYRVPKEEEQGRRWIINSRREDLLEKPIDYCHRNILICSDHFESSQFKNTDRKTLIKGAVPALFNVPNPPPKVTPSRRLILRKHVETESQRKKREAFFQAKLEATKAYIRQQQALRLQQKNDLKQARRQALLAKKAKQQALLRVRKKKLKAASGQSSITTVLDSVKSVLTSDELIHLKTRLSNSQKGRNVYCKDYKRLAIALSYKSTASYKVLSRRLKLPPKRTVSNWISKVQFSEGFDEKVLAILAQKTRNMDEGDCLASLLIDEMSLKEWLQYDHYGDRIFGAKRCDNGSFAYPSNVLVLMVTGLKAKWKQTLAYFFTKNAMPGGDVLALVKTAITKLQEAGVTILNLTSDQGSNFSSLITLLEAKPEQPYFEFLNRRIFITPDPPHLIKSCRNALLDHNIMTRDGLASWTHLKAFYHHDKLGSIRMAKKLTDDHLSPPPLFGKMIVRYATQVLSHSVAKGLQACVTNKSLSEMVLPTAYFCERFDTVFDILNTSRPSDPKPFKRGLTPQAEDQFHFIQDSIKYIRELKILDSEGNMVNSKFRWLDGMVMALNSVRFLMLHLCHEKKFKFLLTRRLNQDPLENYFSIIRQRNGFDSNPSCYGFSTAYKITMINWALANEKPKGTNCEDDDNVSLLDFPLCGQPAAKKILSHQEVADVVGKEYTLTESQVLEYMAGYFYKRLLKLHKEKCSCCHAHGEKIGATTNENILENVEVFLFLKRYCTEEATLYRCSNHFKSYVKAIMQIATCCFDGYMDEIGIIDMAVQTSLFYLVDVPQFCQESMKERLVKIVCRTIILNKLKWHNNDLKAARQLRRKTIKKGTKVASKLKKLAHQ